MSVAIPIARYVAEEDGAHSINLLVDGLHCPACVTVIEGGLAKQPEVKSARLNFSTRRLKVVWSGTAELGERWIMLIQNMGYRAMAFDPATLETQEKREEKFLLRCLAVAGFASGNLMLFSVPLWSSDSVAMGDATRTMFHWVQAIISIPAIAYCGLPFYRSAAAALRQWRTNMDVPISVAVILATLMSIYETVTFGHHSYFDSAVMLLFFLLIGRYLEARARGRARSAAADLLQMMTGFATVIEEESGKTRIIPLMEIQPGMVLLVAAGEKISADGEVLSGSSELDTSLITGETLPRSVTVGDPVFAGTLNLHQPLTIRATKAHERSLMADIVRLMETAEQSQAKYVTLADRISGWYTPVVHILAAATFIGWEFFTDTPWQIALLYAATVLIITCPCALGLAVPVVQVIATGKLLRQGILLKSGSALERLAGITHAIFDKTGTLTLGRPTLLNAANYDAALLQQAASLASHSKHPLAVALCAAYAGEWLPIAAQEVKGCGVEAPGMKLGKRSWAAPNATASADTSLEMWFAAQGIEPVRFAFADQTRTDAKSVVETLQQAHIQAMLLTGDRAAVADQVAAELGIPLVKAEVNPAEKTQEIAALKQSGAQVLMVGDGLNDAPSLATATVSMSPTSAMDITQNAADIVFQGEGLSPVVTAWRTAKFSQTLVRQNFMLAILYNVFAIPMAVAGYVTPLIAAIAMSSSSLIVIGNALRLNLKGITK